MCVIVAHIKKQGSEFTRPAQKLYALKVSAIAARALLPSSLQHYYQKKTEASPRKTSSRREV